MQPKVLLLLGLGAALAAATALFFVLDRPGAEERSAAAAAAARPAAPGPGTARADLAAAQGEREESAEPSRVAAKTAPRVAPGMELVRTASEEGGDDLYGRVIGGFGVGVAGAEVEVEGVGETADGLIQMLGGSTDKKAVTGPDGTFRVPRPARWEEIRVNVEARGYLPFTQSQDLLEVEGDQNLGVFELAPGVVLGGEVVDDAGKPVADADVRRIEEDQRLDFGLRFDDEGVVKTDAEGRFLLPHEHAGRYVLLVQHPSYPLGRFSGETPPEGGEDTGLVLALARAARIAGRVEGFPSGREHVRVSAMLRDASTPTDESMFTEMMEDAGFGVEGLEGDVGPDGAFVIEGLEAGKTYALRAFVRGGFFGRDACSDERQARAEAEDVRLTWKPGGELAFRVVDAATRGPVDDVEVRFRWDSQGANGFPDQSRTRRFAGGDVLLEELRPKAHHTALSIIVSAPGYLEVRRDSISVGGEGRVELGTIELRGAPTVKVLVVDAEGKSVSGAKVRLEPLDAEGDPESDDDMGFFTLKTKSSTGKSDSEGVCELAAVPTATARLEVTHPRFCDFAVEPVAMPAQGVREETARLIEGGRIAVLVVDAFGLPVGDVEVEHRYPEGTEQGQAGHSSNRRGEVRLKHQAPGEHRFRTREQSPEVGAGDAREAAWQSVLVLDGKEARISLQVAARASVQGVITQAGVPLDRATVTLLKPAEAASEEILIEFQVRVGNYETGGPGSVDRTDRKGNYKLEDVPAGRYRLSVTHADRALPHVVPLDVREGENRFDLDLPVTAIEGRVTDADGRPVQDATVRVMPAPQEGTAEMIDDGRDAVAELFGGGDSGVKTDSEGRYRVVGVPADKAVVVRVSGDEYVAASSQEVTLRTGELRERVDVQVQRGGILRVRVLAETPPFSFLRATYAGEGEDGVAPRMAVIRRGEAVFRGLKPGAWRVSQSGFDGEEGEKTVTATVSAPGETVIDFTP